jgi:hypothetical protein
MGVLGNGLEYNDNEFFKFFELEGIIHHFTPQQNEVAERLNKTLAEKARCIRLNAGLSKVFWAEVVKTTRFIINISPTSDIDFNILQEFWSENPVNYKIFKILVV